MTIWLHVLGVFFGVVLPVLGWLQHRASEQASPRRFSTRDKVVTYWAGGVQLAVLAGLTVWAWLGSGRTLDALGLTVAPVALPTGLALAGFFALVYGADLLEKIRPVNLAATRQRWRTKTPFMPATRHEVAHSLSMVLAAAVFEEILYRGFLIAYVAHFTGTGPFGLALAVAIPAFVFGLAHLYQGGRAVVLTVLLASCFGAIVVVTGSLWIPIVLHFVIDLIGSLLGPWLMRGDAPSAAVDASPT